MRLCARAKAVRTALWLANVASDNAGMSDTAPTPPPDIPDVAPTVPTIDHKPATKEDLPPLLRDRAFLGMTATQFLGAFNDNLFKQLVLLLSVAVVTTSSAKGGHDARGEPQDLQGIAQLIFALPFVLLSGFAGFLSDRHSKRRIIVLSKVSEIAVMLLGMAAFAAYRTVGLPGVMAVLLLMGTQSTFFGPGKYGILPEMLRERDLPRANGVILMTTFLAIILGTAVAGFLKEPLEDHQLWMASIVCVAIGLVGMFTSLSIREGPAANPQLRFQLSALAIPPDMRRLLWHDRPLLAALLAACMFWLVGGMVLPAVNSLGIHQFNLGERQTSLMTAGVALGIAIGCLLAGELSRGRVSGRIVQLGAWGMVLCLLLLGNGGYQRSHFLGVAGSVIVLILTGFFAGMFVVPIQVFLQSRPPQDKKGRMIATMNIATWIAILISGLLYTVFDWIRDQQDWQRATLFAFTAVLMLPVALFYRPKDETLQ